MKRKRGKGGMDIYFPPLLAPLETNSALGIAAVMHRLHTVHFCMAVLQDCFFEGKVRKNFLENGSREVGSGIVYSGPRIWRLEVPLARKIPESHFSNLLFSEQFVRVQ